MGAWVTPSTMGILTAPGPSHPLQPFWGLWSYLQVSKPAGFLYFQKRGGRAFFSPVLMWDGQCEPGAEAAFKDQWNLPTRIHVLDQLRPQGLGIFFLF